jgi:uncharacterized protein YneF (UPF0154 family)
MKGVGGMIETLFIVIPMLMLTITITIAGGLWIMNKLLKKAFKNISLLMRQ